MRYIAIDTSAKNLTIIAYDNGKIHKVFDEECGVNHSTELMPKLEELLQKANFDLKDADFLACVVGAGSFTGIRIGVATVKALCFAYKKPCLSITSFDTLAYNEKEGKVLAVIDAKHNGFYVCGYDNYKIDFKPSYIMKERLFEIAGDYQVVSSTDIEGIKVKKVSVCDGLINAIDKKINQVTDDVSLLSPLYVRKSQAEENR